MTLHQLRTAARLRWGRATPYRLGLLAGALSPASMCPYRALSAAARDWHAGWAYGKAHPQEFAG